MTPSGRLWKSSFFQLPDWARAMFFRNWGVILCRRPAGGPSSQVCHRYRNFDQNSIRGMCWIHTAICLRALCSFHAKPAGTYPTRKTAFPMFCQLRTSTSRGGMTCCQIVDFSPSRLRMTLFRNAIDSYRRLWYLQWYRTICFLYLWCNMLRRWSMIYGKLRIK